MKEFAVAVILVALVTLGSFALKPVTGYLPMEDRAQYLGVYMNHLRKKIELRDASQKLLRTETGIGYRLVVP